MGIYLLIMEVDLLGVMQLILYSALEHPSYQYQEMYQTKWLHQLTVP